MPETNSSANPLEFYFDFSSPYAYLMSERIDALAARFGRKVKWRPILLGAVFKATGSAPLTLQYGPKARYSELDFARSARFLDIPFRLPADFPVASQIAARAYYWLHGQDCATARAFAHAIFRRLFVDNGDISSEASVLGVAAGLGVDQVALAAALGSPELKARLKAEVDAAIARGVFGAPLVYVDGEAFFGVDRLPQIERWLDSGGF